MPDQDIPPGWTTTPPPSANTDIPAGWTTTPPTSVAPTAPKLAPMPNVPGLSTPPPSAPGILNKVLNYNTGVMPIGMFQGAGKGLISTAYGARDLADKIPGVHQALNAVYAANGMSPEEQAQDEKDIQGARQALTAPKGIGQGTGKFLEQAAEYAIPSTEAGKAVEGAGLLGRALTQAGVGATVSGLQSGGDPKSIAVGAGLGAGGELGGAAIGRVKKLLTARAATPENFFDAFKATPKQKATISQAIEDGTLSKWGITPDTTPNKMLDTINQGLDEASDYYHDPQLATKVVKPDVVLDALDEAQKSYTQNGVITNKAAYDTIGKQISIVQDMAAAKNGTLTFDNINHLKLDANQQTNFNSPGHEKNLWKVIGNAYRTGEGAMSSSQAEFNHDWKTLSDLKEILEDNIGQGKGIVPSGLEALKDLVVRHGISGAAGEQLGHALFGPVGGALGTIIGGYAGPKIGDSLYQLGKNAIESPVGQKVVAGIGSDAGTLMSRAGQAIAQETARRAIAPKPITVKP